MSRASPDNPLEPFPAPYTEHQDIMMHDDVEESATLAEPMTLEGAKQLAATSVVVPVSTPTPTAGVTCASASPPPQLPLAISPLSGPALSAAPHHHGPPTLTHHSHHHPSSAHSHHHHHHHHLTSPPHHIQSPPAHLAVTTSPLNHHHHIWGPSSVVTHDDEDDDQKDLPSTVDIGAIRDSPSPDPSASAQLVTINANWDSVEDQEQMEEDSDAEDSESEGSDSDSDSRASSRTHSRSPSHSPSRVESRSPSNSRSESGSQESDSDSSGWSDDSSSNSDGEKKKDERMFSPFSKPLPRRKPQLTAAKVGGEKLPDQRSTADDTKTTITKTTTSSINATQLFTTASISPSPSRFSPVHSISTLPQMPPDKFFMQYRSPDVKFSTKPLLDNMISSKSSILSTEDDDGDDEKEDEQQELIEKEEDGQKRISEIPNISKKRENKLPNPVTMIGVFDAKSSRITDPLNLNNTISETNEYNDTVSTKSDHSPNESSILSNQSEKIITLVEGSMPKDQVSINRNVSGNVIRKEETKSIGTDTPVFTKENDVLSNKKEVKKNSRKSEEFSPEERERRRRQKEQQLNREFDRLLFSTKSPPNKSSTEPQSLLLSPDRTNIIHPKPSTININHIAEINRTIKPSSDIIINNITTLKSKEKSSVSVKKEKNNITSENLIKSCVENQGTSKDFGDRRKDSEKLHNKSHKAITDIKPKESHSEIEKKAPDKKTHSKELFTSNKGNILVKTETSKSKISGQDVDKNINSYINSEMCASGGKLTDLSVSDKGKTEKFRTYDLGAQSKKVTPPADQKNKIKTKSKISDSSLVKDDSRTSLKVSQIFASTSKCKLDENNHGCDQNKQKDIDKSKDENDERFVIIRPTIADLVKGRERRKSTDTEKVISSSEKSKKGGSIYTETSSDSESSEELNEKVDLDTEQTQTFSVSESNFNQGRLTMKIAAMKMAKFGKTGLREVSSGALPTRSDLLVPPSLETASVSMSFSPFRRPRNMAPKSNTEHCKVKTAAERKTYSDALPPNGSIRNSKKHRRKGSLVKGEMRVPANSLYQRGSGGIGGGSLVHHGISGSAGGVHGHHPNMEDDEITISRLAHHFPQISLDTLTDDGLQELDQEDLAALLPDISSGSGHQDGSSVSLDDFTDEVDVSRDSDTEEGDDHASNDLPGDDDLPDVILREAIDSMSMTTGEDVAFSNSGLMVDLDDCSSRSIQHSQLHRSSQQHLRAITKSPRADIPSRHRDDVVSEKKRNKGSRHHRHSTSGNELTVQEDETEPPPMPELEQESYVSIDCNVSNVSPDSGIQSHTGSPMHHIGSPLQHHSPLYASSSAGKSVDSCGSSHHRPFSPISSQDSPPPPTLLPAVTPPHMISSPKYDYDDPHSPQMPLLKIQVDLPFHLNEECAKEVTLKEQGSLKKRGPGRPKLECSDKPRRPRGRPKGSKGKRRAQNTNEEAGEEARLSDSEKEQNEGEYGMWKSEIINDRLRGDNDADLLSEKSNNNKWNEDIQDLDCDDLPPPPEPIPPLKRGPGRPKKVPPVLEPSVPITDISLTTSSIVQTEHKADNCALASDNYSSAKLLCATEESTEFSHKSKKSNKINKLKNNLIDRRPVGRPRKSIKEEDIELSQNVPTTVASKKCFSERIMHKIINEKVRNSEKSDKLSVRVEEAGSITESHGGNNPYSFQELSTSHTLKHNKQVGKVKHSKQGLVLEENKKKRGRKKELPAIFEKIYGNQDAKPKNKTEQVRPAVVSSNLHSKEKHKKKKKKSKHFRSKHKNIVDPVFLADLEDLTSGLVQCSISKALSLPQVKAGEVLLPSIFRLRKFSLAVKKRKGEKPRTSDRESGTEGDSGKDKSSKRKKKQQELPKQGRERTEANEQRLPLKKRHRHISTAVQPEFVKDDVKTTDAVLLKTCQTINVVEKDFNKVDKQEKERNERLDNKLMKPYLFKGSPETNKLIRSEPKSVKILEETQKRLSFEIPFNASSTVFEENNLTVKCTRDDEFLKVHQIIESRRPSESENLNTSEVRISEQHSNDTKEVTYKEISEPTASSRTRTTTTTPKKRHRLEASIEVSSLPSSATRATLYLSKGKHDKDSAKPPKDLSGCKNPVSRSPKSTIRDSYIKDALNISPLKIEETMKSSSAVPDSPLSDVKHFNESKMKSSSEVKYKSFSESKLKYNTDYKTKNSNEIKSKTRSEESIDKMLIQVKNKIDELKPENITKPTNEAKNKPSLENKIKVNDTKSKNLIEAKENNLEANVKLVLDSKSKCVESKSNLSESKSKSASENSVTASVTNEERPATKIIASSPRSKSEGYTIDNKQSSEQKFKNNIESKHRSSNKGNAIDNSGKLSSSRSSSSESKNRLHNMDIKAKSIPEDYKEKSEKSETKSRNMLDTTNKMDIDIKEPSSSKNASRPINSTKSSPTSEMKVKNKDNDKNIMIADDKYRYEGKRSKHRYRHLSDHRHSSNVENTATLQDTAKEAFEVKNSKSLDAKQKSISSTDSVLNMYIDSKFKNAELRNAALDDTKLRRIAEVKLTPLGDEKSRIIESRHTSYDTKSKSHVNVNDEIVLCDNLDTVEPRSYSPNKSKSKSQTEDKSKSPLGRKSRQKVEIQNKISDELKLKTTHSEQQSQIMTNNERKDLNIVNRMTDKFEKVDPIGFESSKVINEERHHKVSVEASISIKAQANISVEDKSQSCLLEKKSFVEHKIKSRRFGYKEITSNKLDDDEKSKSDEYKSTEKKIHYQSVEENIKCSIEEKGKSYMERKSSRRAGVEERAKSNHAKVENDGVSKDKSLLEPNPDNIVDGNILSCKTFIEHKIKKSLRKSNVEEKAKVTMEKKAEIYVEHKSKSGRRTATEEERTKVAVEEKVKSFVEHKSKTARKTNTEEEKTKVAVEEKVESYVELKSKSARRAAIEEEKTKVAVEEKVESYVELKSKSARRTAIEEEKTKVAIEEKVKSFVEHKSKSTRKTATEEEKIKVAVEEKVESFVEHKSKSARKNTTEEEITKVAVEKTESYVEVKSKSARKTAVEEEKTKIAVEEKVESYVEVKSKSARRTATEEEKTKVAAEEKVESFVEHKSKSARKTATEEEITKVAVEEKAESYVQHKMRLSRKSVIEDKFLSVVEEKVGSYVQHKTKTRKSVIKEMAEPRNSYTLKPTIDKINFLMENKTNNLNTTLEQCISEHQLSLHSEDEASTQIGRKVKSPLKLRGKPLDEQCDQSNKIIDIRNFSPACTPQHGLTAGKSPLIEPAQIVDAEEKFKALLAKGTDSNIYNDTTDMTPDDIKICDSNESKISSSASTVNAVDECKMKNINEEFKSKVFEIIQQPMDGISHGSDLDSSIPMFPNEGSHSISMVVKESSGTHSDSDIPSEHEPLCESDQSGFMSDKEGPKQEIPIRIPQKRRKKKRELRSPLPKVADKPTPAEVADDIELPPPIKKKHKKRKANRTGFPTIKRKKKKPKPVIEESEYFTSEGVDGVVEIAPINLKPVECFESTDHIEESRYYERENRTGMNPPLTSESLSASEDLETNKYEVSSSHFHNSDILQLKSSTEDIIPKKPRPRGRPKKIVTSTEHHATDILVPKQLRESLRDRALLKNETFEEEKTLEEESEKPSLAEILMHVATGIGSRTRRKRDLSEESLKYSSSEFKRLRRHGEDEGEECDTVMMSSESMPSSEPPSGDESYRTMSAKRKVPRWKKKYLVAGLFSDYYKENESRKRNGEISQPKNKLTYDPEEHRHGLLPPPCYCRKWLREREIDFRLPYDLWWLHEHNKLPGRDVVPSWNYKKVKSNIYFDVRPSQNNSETQPCNCKRPSKPGEAGCGDDCINRMMFLECTIQTCPIADVCSNQPIQRHETITLQRFMTVYKGWGMKAVDLIKAGTFIMEYVGEVVSEKEFKHRMQTKYVHDTHHYCLNLDRGMVIDGHRMGGDCRFVNHSCNPNCEMQKWYVKGEYRMALFSLKDIELGTELNYDYNFSLFNPAEGQECKCGSENCRGVIGGKSQRVNGLIIEDKKKNLKKDMSKKRKRLGTEENEMSLLARPQIAPIKPLSHQQQLFILARRCFLIRNLNKVRRSRDRLARGVPEKKPEEIIDPDEEPTRRVEKFQTHFTALNTARSVKTRRLAQAEDDPEMTRLAKLAQIFKDIFDKLVASRDAKDKPLATPFMSLPSKKKYLSYYTRVGEPIDLAIVEKNIMTGHYTTAEGFDRDVMRLFANNLRYFGRNTDIGQMAVGLRRVYSECKLQFKPLLEEVLGEDHLPLAFANSSPNEEFEDEDVIRCVCNLHRDEGVMIQCERCLVWQHCDCMGVLDNAPEHYLCEECSPRLISPEVPMNPQPQEVPRDHKYFITLLRDNLQLKQGDSVYILRDRPNQKPGERRQPAYKLVKDVKPHDLLIFKIENLWIDEKGDKFAFGHHFLRPHETFHEPWRKFFPNEVIRSPLCEILPLDMIVNHCWVLDLNTYCRGRPIGSSEDHVYVCEYRVDKSARIFSKISKPKYPICTKPFAFITYQEKIRPQRTYTPHEVISNSRGRSSSSGASKDLVEDKVGLSVGGSSGSRENSSSRSSSGQRTAPASGSSTASTATNNGRSSRSREPPTPTPPEIPTEQQPITTTVRKPEDKPQKRAKKRARCNMVATKLLNLLPSKGAADLSYLLENNKRQRKKTAAFAS